MIIEKDTESNQRWTIIQELHQFELGTHLLGFNKEKSAYWSNLLATYPRVRETLNWELDPLEKFLFERAPLILATQERFEIFQKELQKCVNKFRSNCMRLMSVPCGEMEDLKSLDYSRFEKENKYYWIAGIDNEIEGVQMGKSKLIDRERGAIRMYREDLWKFELENNLKMDLVTSHGFNTHLKKQEDLVNFYKKIANWLKKNGVFITSFLAPLTKRNKELVNEEDLNYQQTVFEDVLKVDWLNYSTEEETRNQLQEAGFEIVKIIYDQRKLFPTVVARKL